MAGLPQQSSVKQMELMLKLVACLPDSLVNFPSSSSLSSFLHFSVLNSLLLCPAESLLYTLAMLTILVELL